jgi:hypothetical protein
LVGLSTPALIIIISLFLKTTAQKKMATSMAATLAASMPSAQVAPTPSVPTYEKIPESMLKVIDVEVGIPLASVQLDSLVRTISKIRPSPQRQYERLLSGSYQDTEA